MTRRTPKKVNRVVSMKPIPPSGDYRAVVVRYGKRRVWHISSALDPLDAYAQVLRRLTRTKC